MQGRIRNLLQHLLRLVTAPREELSLFQRTLAFWVRLVVYCARELKRDKAPQVAAALTYHTLFSLVPMLVLGLLVFHSVRGLESSAERFENMVINVLLPETALDPSSSPLRDPNALDTQGDFDDARALIRERFGEYISKLSELNLTGIGIAGLLTFLYGAISLLGTIETSFDSIYRAEQKRPPHVRYPLYFTIMSLGPVVLVGSQVLQDQILLQMASRTETAWLSTILATLSPLLATWLVLFALFFTVPNTKVRRRAAVSGSFVTALLWLAMQELFGIYVGSTVITSLYGALAVIPILLLWMYLTWLVILFGLEVAFSLQFLHDEGPWRDDYTAPIAGDPAWQIPILTLIARGFENGESTSRQTLRTACGLPLDVLTPFLNRLREGGWIHEVIGPEGEPAYALARPPSQVPLREVLDVELPEHEPGSAWEYLNRLRTQQATAIGDDTLMALLEQATPRAP